MNSVKESIEKTYPVKPIVIATEKKLISFRKTIPMVGKITSSKPKEIILELPEFSEFMDINFSCCLDMTTFSQWDYRDFSIMIDDGVDDDPDVGVRNEKVFGYRIYSSGGEKYLSIYQGFKILSNVKKLRIKMQTNGTVGVYSSYNLTEQVFVVNGTGV